jgi:hypothetical protein
VSYFADKTNHTASQKLLKRMAWIFSESLFHNIPHFLKYARIDCMVVSEDHTRICNGVCVCVCWSIIFSWII